MGFIVDRDEMYLYGIAVKAGILQRKYSRNQFDLRNINLLGGDDVSREKEISLRAAVQNESLCAGQGFLRCNCCGTNKCQTNRSKRFKESYNAVADVTILCLVVINK